MKIQSTYPINDEVVNDLKKILEEYTIIESVEIHENDPSKKIYLGEKDNRTCRFCQKKHPQTSFKNVSHTVPEFLSNKSLLSYYECDVCNNYFSMFDSEFARILLPFNTFSSTKNKKNKTPKFNNGLEIFEDVNSIINIKNLPDNIIGDPNNIEFELETPTYIPNYVYRSLIKMGISVIGNDKINNYRSEIAWLMSLTSDTITESSMIFSLFPFARPTNKIRCIVLERKVNVSRNIPKTLMSLSYKNFSFQTFFPLHISENFETFFPHPHILPTPLDLYEELKDEKKMSLINLDGKIKEKGEEFKFSIKSI
ncbi:hypothetical protein [Chryseobacterium profundimaris]|uniref:HNH endonuclease 5 domain-containing protein n=1 Tax=Chryseobacterium profundimaris TaxID=1387275 RepID=A0ABY1NU88_9FLAO|nr:hypothetical protein [Chryseobacterium profundimaris]SMP18134.1 hypothetical protein SAMN06264346_104213 [Chryseobacterium profundimaris]